MAGTVRMGYVRAEGGLTGSESYSATRKDLGEEKEEELRKKKVEIGGGGELLECSYWLPGIQEAEMIPSVHAWN